jgi:hypothetical protein
MLHEHEAVASSSDTSASFFKNTSAAETSPRSSGSTSVAEETLRRLGLPRLGEEVREHLGVGATKLHADGGETLAPPDLSTDLGLAVNCGEDATLVEHHVHVVLVPQGGEDPAGDAERRPAVMILLDRLGQSEREFTRPFAGNGQGCLGPARSRGEDMPKLHNGPSKSRAAYSRRSWASAISRTIPTLAAYLLRCGSLGEASSIAAEDPYAIHGVCDTEVVEWRLVGIDPNLIDPNLAV